MESNFWSRRRGSRVLCQGSRVFSRGSIFIQKSFFPFFFKTLLFFIICSYRLAKQFEKNTHEIKKKCASKKTPLLWNLQLWLARYETHVVRVSLRPPYQPYSLRTSGRSLPVKKIVEHPWARFIERWLIIYNPGLSQIWSKVFLSKNMQLELTKYCRAFTPRYSNDNTKCYSKQYLGR